MPLTLPNILTLFRLIAAPMVGLVFLFLPRPIADITALVLFVLAAMTDYLDGVLARAWDQISRFGSMLDPIADKAMVVIALSVVLALYGVTAPQDGMSFNPMVLIPITIILFREVFVSGLREFLGDTAGTLKVTKLAKWKTTIQMVAVVLMFCIGIFEHYLWALTIGMDPGIIEGVLSGEIPDEFGLGRLSNGLALSATFGIGLLWLAAILTMITGIDYYRKARPHLVDHRGSSN